jgi:DNA mismatch repair protein MutS2
VDRAEALAGQQHSNLDKVLERLERDAEAARQERLTLETERRALERARHDAEQHEKTLRERLKTGLDRERTAALDEARKLRDEVRALKRELQAPEKRKDVRALEASKGRAEQVITTLVAQQAAATKAQAGAAPSVAQLVPGTRVYVLSLGCDAELLRAPDERGRTEVRAGALTIKIDASDLRLAGPKGARLPEPAPRKETPAGKVAVGFADATPQGVHNTLDVRGMRADEAIAATERFLDAQIERDGDVAYVIHGHGTGALKKELRRWLETSPYVRASRPAEQHQGGDGVTAVLLS